MRAGHPRVGDRRRPAGLDAGVAGLNVGVRADHGRHAPVEQPGDRDLLARGLGVKVDDDDLRSRARLLDQHVQHLERAYGRRHEENSLEVRDRDRRPVGGVDDGEPAAG